MQEWIFKHKLDNKGKNLYLPLTKKLMRAIIKLRR